MSQTSQRYAIDSLASTGLVVQHAQLAAKLRPDLFASHIPFGLAGVVVGIARARGAKAYKAHADGFNEPLIVWSVSPANLAQRIEWIVGVRVIEVVQDIESTRPPQPAPEPQKPNYEAERRQKLEAIAAQEPPAYDCPLRGQILLARRELGMEV